MQETLVRFLGWEDPLEKDRLPTPVFMGFPGGSDGKESTCSVGDPGSIPGLGTYPGEAIGYPVQYSWASLVAQMVNNLPAVWETLVRFPSEEDSPGEAWQPTPVFFPGESPWTEEPGRLYSPWDCKESNMTERLSTHIN